MQTTNHILMIRPVRFGYNAETAVNNAFQVKGEEQEAQAKALNEFDAFVQKLRENGVEVTVVSDTDEPHTPDSIFPNNWISFHDDGKTFLYPMFAENRRHERKSHVLQIISKNFQVGELIDFSKYEDKNEFLEGTGSMVLDRDKRIAYACISPRTDRKLFELFCKKAGYRPVAFTSVDQNGQPIYHTNVMMCIGDQYVVICLDSISDAAENMMVKQTIRQSGKTIVEISYDQMNRFAGNMLQVNNAEGKKFLVMSTQAFDSLNREQAEYLNSINPIIHSPLDTIETNGGGSARCMMAEVHLPERS